MGEGAVTEPGWTFLTNHSHVLICLARNPDLRLRDLSEQVGITERAVQSIIRDLEVAGIVARHRVGRRNRYEVHPEHPMRHPVEAGHTVAEVLEVLVPRGDPAVGGGGTATDGEAAADGSPVSGSDPRD